MRTWDNTFITLINLTYEGEERERQLAAFNKYPTLLTDCPLTRQRKEALRKEYLKRFEA